MMESKNRHGSKGTTGAAWTRWAMGALAPAGLIVFVGIALVALVAAGKDVGETRPAPRTAAAAPDWKQVEQALGKTGSMQPGDVYKIGIPRSDLSVTIGDVKIKPALALGGWVAFK